jgi:uncharacterized membrane protein HdeD (DUF308 family)
MIWAVTLIILGPLSSASPNGAGTLFSVLFILVGAWGLIRTWSEYRKRRADSAVPLSNVVAITALAVLFMAAGFWGLFR